MHRRLEVDDVEVDDDSGVGMRPKGRRKRKSESSPCRFAGISPSDAETVQAMESGVPEKTTVHKENSASLVLFMERSMLRLGLASVAAAGFCWAQAAAMNLAILVGSAVALGLFLLVLLRSKHAIDAFTSTVTAAHSQDAGVRTAVGAPNPHGSGSGSGSGYRADVDGLRAVAVVAVIIFHFNEEWLPGGFVGVDVFFVISGFVVTGSLLREPSASPATFLGAFYLRRVKRLGPALLVTVVLTTLLMSLLIPPYTRQLDEFYLSGQLALIGWANQHYATLPTGYFDRGAGSLKVQ